MSATATPAEFTEHPHGVWTRIGGIALTGAAVDGVTAWSLPAFVSSVVYAHAATG